MTGIPAHREPETEAEREIATAMMLALQAFEQIRVKYPTLPETAVSTGFINFGVQIGVRYADAPTVASYLNGVARIIAPLN